MVELAELQPGQAVLDLATGIGEPAVTAAFKVGPAGRVVAVDQAPQMLGLARRRVAALGLTNVELLELDVEALDLPEQSFDAVLSRWGLMFLPDLDATLARLARLLRPGGRFAAAVWSEASRVPVISTAADVIREALAAPPPPPGMPTPFDLADQASLERRLERAGLVDVRGGSLTVTFEFVSAEAYARFVSEVSPPLPGLEEQPPKRRAEIWAAVVGAARRHAGANGVVRMANAALCVAARRPRPSSGPDSSAEETRRSPELRPVRCPFCGGGDTRLESAFGSTLGFAQYWCASCRTVFEYLKWDEDHSGG